MSRRAAEEAIKAGRVTVNGEIALIGQDINTEKDTVRVDGKIIKKNTEQKNIYIMLNKPVGYLTSLSDKFGRPCIIDLLSELSRRVYPCGRLDFNSEGIVILTDDGNFAAHLMHPRHQIPKIYEVNINGEATGEQLDLLRSPMKLPPDNYEILPVEVDVIHTEKEGSKIKSTLLRFKLFEGRNRQIRRMCEICGLKITRLRRISIGNIKLGSLKTGSFRYLTDDEVEYLLNN